MLLTAYTNGVAEELFFRGALWSAVKDTHPVAKTTFAYAAARNPALVLGGAVVSVLFGLQRRASGGILAPALTHVTWLVLMLSYLPPPVPNAPAARGRSRLTRATDPRNRARRPGSPAVPGTGLVFCARYVIPWP